MYLLAILLLLTLLLPSLGRPRETAKRIVCTSHLRQFGQAMQLYADGHGGRYPSGFLDLELAADLDPNLFVCQDSSDEIPSGTTLQERAKSLSKPGHLSYVYCAQGLTSASITPDTTLAYEPPTNHRNDGGAILFGDGHVEFLTAKSIQYLKSELAAGHNPPRSNPQFPLTPAPPANRP